METYIVTIERDDGSTFDLRFEAEDRTHAEEQAIDALNAGLGGAHDEHVVQISRIDA